jgi:4-alpha-glucanotransferase
MSARPLLHQLADALGIVAEYVDQSGRETRRTSDDTRAAILRAFGIDASTEESCAAELERRDAAAHATPIPPVRVVGEGTRTVELGHARAFVDRDYELTLTLESGERTTTRGRVPASGMLPLPGAPEAGYHALALSINDARVAQSLIVAPASCVRPAELLDGQRGLGITTQLYSLTSARNQGIGDFTDLSSLARWAGERGASFVGVNPLHALGNAGDAISPYSPVSRLFKNPIYLDVEAIPELESSDAAKEILARSAPELTALRALDHVDYARVAALKRTLFAELFRAFLKLPEADTRKRAHRAFVDDGGRALTSFATFMALDDELAARTGTRAPWQQWPEEFRHPESRAVHDFASRNAHALALHRWLQFEIDRQLAVVAANAAYAGLRIGVYQDLAVGSAPGGCDTWAFRELFVDDCAIGAPPDGYSADGQNWGLPPLDPHALAADGYRYFIRVVRNNLRHAGALRIDHAVGLFRQFWIPRGMSGKDGAYVRFPAADLLGILALESRRARAVVVGEDLGTVPPEVPAALHARGILSSRVLYFERDDAGRFLGAADYERDALATANTHDMPTLEGFFRGRDIAIKRDVGIVPSDVDAKRMQKERQREKRELFRRLSAEGVLPDGSDGDTTQVRGAVHAFLQRTPSSLVGISLDDLVGEVEPVNVPGVGADRFESWTRKLHVPIEEWSRDEEVSRALSAADAPDDVAAPSDA